MVKTHDHCGQSVVLPFAMDAGLTEEQTMGMPIITCGSLHKEWKAETPAGR